MSSYQILIKNKIVEYEATPNYGLITEKSIILDDCEIFKEFLIGYRLYKIKCWTENKAGIIGIQLCYKDRETNEEIISINKHRAEDTNYQEFILEPLELITGITIWKNNSLNGFEIRTNKKRIKRFGYDIGEKILPEEFEENNLNIILGFFFTYEPNIGISSMGCYYLNRKYFSIILYSGILYLRIRLKDEQYKNEIKKKLNDIDISDRALYYTCLLPSNHFFGIIKYTWS
jgi:hypothetical protein